MKQQKTSSKNSKYKNVPRIILYGILIIILFLIGVMSYNLISHRTDNGKAFREISARVERLEFCVAKQIHPCSYEKLHQWNQSHEFSEQFKPTVDDGFMDYRP